MKIAALILILLMLAGCASSHSRDDDDSPRKVCPSTSIGGEAKTFCY